MLITGFDEPKLGVLYLYKLLKNHRLLQTIARVNRPYIGKASGLVVDYVGILKEWIKALNVYLDEDKKVIEKTLIDKEKAFERFETILNKIKEIFGNLVGNFEKGVFDKSLELIKKPEDGDTFRELYTELRKWFEFLKSDSEMIKYMTDYKWISALYVYYKKTLKPSDIDETDIDEKVEKIYKKTLQVIHEVIEVKELLRMKEPMTIDLNYIKSLKNLNLTEEAKVIMTLTTLQYMTQVVHRKNPIYKSIAEKVEQLVEKWRKNEIDLKTLGVEVEKIILHIR